MCWLFNPQIFFIYFDFHISNLLSPPQNRFFSSHFCFVRFFSFFNGGFLYAHTCFHSQSSLMMKTIFSCMHVSVLAGFIIIINDDYTWGGEEIEINVSLMTFQRRITQLYLTRGENLCVPKSIFVQQGGEMESNYFSYFSTMKIHNWRNAILLCNNVLLSLAMKCFLLTLKKSTWESPL